MGGRSYTLALPIDIMGTEGKYVAYPCTRTPTATTFASGLQEFPFSVGPPYAWCPKKSYFRFLVSITNAATPPVPLKPSDLTTIADNFCGNLYDNMYLKAGSTSISKCTQYAYQCSALKARVEHSQPWLKSMGSSVAANESSFQKRILSCSRWSPAVASSTGIGAYDERDCYKPYAGIAAGNTPEYFADATVSLTTGGVLSGVNTDFNTGMPLGGANIGGAVLPGDIVVIAGIPYTVEVKTNATTLTVRPPPSVAIAAPGTTDWFIVRSDTIRCPQAYNSFMVLWQPPLGIMNYDGFLSSGEFSFVMSPSADYELNSVETKNPNWSAVRNFKLNVNEVQLMVYQEKMSIPDGIKDYFLEEYEMDSTNYNSNTTFQVAESTRALVIFVQDARASGNPNHPPSMFKVRDNGDLTLQSIQVQYANVSKPNTPYTSTYTPATVANANAINQLQQRYHDSLSESGLDVDALGCETFADWMRRGPYYYFAFDRDMSNKATRVQVSLTFTNNNLAANARVFCCAIKRRTLQIETEAGRIKNIAASDV